jgi:anaerobic magnesium-protoporphyrin IX monomethyl ester cyclase
METRVDDSLRDEDLLDRYAKAGISHIYVGVEATRQDNLDAWDKDISVEQSKRAIALINSHDIVSETSFVLGMPDETPETIAQTLELAKHYAPDLAFFLAITPWPYAKIWGDLKDHLAVHDYSRFNLVEAVVKPDAMTIAEMTGHLGRASHVFYADKLERLPELSPFKRSFMVKVMKILMEHSYLANDMKGLQGEMPPHVKRMIAALEAEHAREAAAADLAGQRATG